MQSNYSATEHTEKLESRVVYENLEGRTEKFPHVYGPIDLQAVRDITPFPPAEHGTFAHHVGGIEPG